MNKEDISKVYTVPMVKPETSMKTDVVVSVLVVPSSPVIFTIYPTKAESAASEEAVHLTRIEFSDLDVATALSGAPGVLVSSSGPVVVSLQDTIKIVKIAANAIISDFLKVIITPFKIKKSSCFFNTY